MTKFNIAILLIICLLFSLSCKRESTSDTYESESVYAPEYASGFEISSFGDNGPILVESTMPWQGATATDISRLLLAYGDAKTPDGFTGQILKSEPKRIVAMSSTHIAMLDALGEISRVCGVSGMRYITNANILANKDRIADVGLEGSLDYEALVASEPDLVILSSSGGHSALEPKLKELGIPFIYFGDYTENSPLGKSEWLIPLAYILGKSEIGQQKFQPIKENYLALARAVSNVAVKPQVLTGAPYEGSWFMPPMESYAVKLIQDAGATPVYQENNGTVSKPVDMERATVLASEADFWINPGQSKSIAELKQLCPKLENTGIFYKPIYNSNRRLTLSGGNDYFETGAVRPDLILADLITIFHPEIMREIIDLEESDSPAKDEGIIEHLYFYRKLQ